jgi:hypothetical protein
VNETRLIGENLLTGEAIANRMRRSFLRTSITGYRESEPMFDIIKAIQAQARNMNPVMAESLWRADLSAWMAAYQWNANKLPEWLKRMKSDVASVSPPWTPGTGGIFGDDAPQRIKFPKLEKAAISLMKRGILQRPEFDELSREMRAKSFTIAGELSDKAIGQVRDLLSDLTVESPSLATFEAKLSKGLKAGMLGPAHVETVYRTNMQANFRDGRESILADPVVSSVFPYQEYLPIRDARTRPDHWKLGTMGLNGTAVYRRDDPFWNLFTPPWGYNCRCGVNLLTIEAAARRRVKEAQKWLKTGIAPANPQHRLQAVLKIIEPEPGFGARRGELAI